MQHPAFKRIGLTGGIGSGKSTFGAMLVARGFALIDADAVSRELTGGGGLAIAKVREAFGDSSIALDGSMDRNQMRTLVFSQPEAKARLEAILHPLVRASIAEKITAIKDKGEPLAILDIPLLVESSQWQGQLDGIIVVDCSEARQLSRVMARNGWTQAQTKAVMAAQASRQERLAVANWVIDNDSDDLSALQKQADAWEPN
jgi:dephospho-CoA kinase